MIVTIPATGDKDFAFTQEVGKAAGIYPAIARRRMNEAGLKSAKKQLTAAVAGRWSLAS
jgi:hypothetical protein